MNTNRDLNDDCSGPPHPIFAAVASPACPDHWKRAAHLIDAYINWIEQAMRLDLTQYRADNQSELGSLQDYYSWPTGHLLVGVVDGQLGAEVLRLEPMPWLMKDAVRMYLQAGFVPIQHYTPMGSRYDGLMAMELRLPSEQARRAAS
ncbi:MAG TPA: hypothetical protein PJ994_00305 [Tepidiformaceae bacterium]|nr:hypothetical protein [Tepidiformaceae bacterium]